MRLSSTRLLSFFTVCILALTTGARADDGVRLTTVAAENGYTYQWIPTEAGATLIRPGVRIVIRAGRTVYEVNSATPIADRAPRFDGRDIIVSARLAEHLRDIARQYPAAQTYAGAPTMMGDSGTIKASPRAGDGTVTLHARHVPGHDAIALKGTGPANVAVEITLTGEISTDLPVVLLSRKTIVTATDGSFSAEMTYGQDSHVRTTLAAIATTLPEGTSAIARVVIGIPSPDVTTSGLDDWPKK